MLTNLFYGSIIGTSQKHRAVKPVRKEETKMKKIVSIILASVLMLGAVFSFASCKAPDDTPTLTVAFSPDFAPMEFVDSSQTGDDKYVGFDILLTYYIAKELNMKVELKPMSFDAVLMAVETGAVDLGISGFSWTPDRAQTYLISDWYKAGENETEQTIIVPKDKAGQYTTAESFNGLKIGAQTASLQDVLVKDQIPGAIVQNYKNLNDAYLALVSGQIEALAVAKGNGDAFISEEDKVAFAGFDFVVDDLYKNNVILLNKSDNELLEKVNAALDKAKAANLYDSWYEACTVLAGISTLDESGYDDNGNYVGEGGIEGSGVVTDADAALKVPYLKFLNEYKNKEN